MQPIGKRVQPVENVCPTCGAGYDFTTDGNGRLVVLHPVTKCVPLKNSRSTTLKPSWERECMECHHMFTPPKNRGSARTCSAKCRKARHQRLGAERRREVFRRFWKAA